MDSTSAVELSDFFVTAALLAHRATAQDTLADPTGIYDFESARGLCILKPHNKSDTASENGDSDPAAPNIALNISDERVSDLEFQAVAVIGIALQLGVIAFAGLGVLLRPWNGR